MRYSVLGFNQSKVLETDLDLTDLMILQYIQQACGATNMCHKLDSNGNPQVWIFHQKIMEDLPILKISEGTLRNRLSALNQKGYVRSTVVANEYGRGSKTYYGITEATMSLIYDAVDATMSQENDTVTRPCHSKMTSDNLLNKDNKLTNNIKEPESFLGSVKQKGKQKKQSLYDKCYAEILSFTNNVIIQDILTEYLKFRLSVKDKPLYFNQWCGMLNKLSELAEGDVDNMRRLAQQSLEKTWLSFYPLTTVKSKSKMLASCESNVRSDKMTEDDYDKQAEFIEKMRREGKVIEF